MPSGSGGATATGPVVVLPDGGTSHAPAVITEALASKVGGPIPLSGKILAATPMSVECKSEGQPVSPTIFGIAFADADKDLGATAFRWGGNTTTRYNHKLGAWNTVDTWFFQNIKIDSHDVFLGKVKALGGRASITVPIMGWVAKDTASASFPVSVFGPQEKTDPYHPDFGNGKKPDGKTLIPPGDPTRTSVKITSEQVGEWVAKMREEDQKRGKRLIYEYILDNEPALWMNAHRDVHPEPTTYDELLEKTIAFGTAVRKADPDAIIAGPAAWGWWEYFYSAKDHEKGFTLKPDRRSHDDQPLLAWYLKKLAEHEKKTGVRILDVLDVHLYPQADGVQGPDGQGGDGGGETDRKTNDTRFRTTRSLWDRGYEDESWIKDKVYLIPRMKEIIAENYPGLGFQIGEYNFGAEHHIAGGVALAEALGRFALFGVSHAYYWTFPKKPKPAYWGFRAYRNYDGQGGHFLERIVPSTAPSGTSLFASRDESGKKWVLVALNFSADRPFDANIQLQGCVAPGALKSYVYTGGDAGFVPGDAKIEGQSLTSKLPPYSITVMELATQ
ncbi:Endoglucanase A precursor [Labilithrix luteola]|uniref:Endoglucanase A n=1 Tax=Labilithrix luteola TaxID=1391654 RepID=A0A0K1Q0J6_9BACT|nr:glycoside hydrolase family 44 protein [Labilithrix luteola]AKU98934.1 Endoglucanase A precursor [Labilithrix luteola]